MMAMTCANLPLWLWGIALWMSWFKFWQTLADTGALAFADLERNMNLRRT